MSILSLARFQFAMTTVFHFFFVPLSIGLAFMVAVMETRYVRRGDEEYKKMTKFWGQMFLLSFAVGVVTGIIQEFQFGMNWSNYSRFVGDIFGAPLAVEALLAFFMESTFIGIWMFGWDRFSKKAHLAFIWLTAIGSMLSALWILAANSFMQKPVGFTVRNGRAELDNFFALLTNDQTWYAYTHVLAAALLVAACFIAGTSAIQMLKKKELSFYKKSLKMGLTYGVIAAVALFIIGDLQMRALLHDQPMKFAAMEGLYEDSEPNAPWTIMASIDVKNKTTKPIGQVPYMLGILSGTSKPIKGMNTIQKEFVEKYGKLKSTYGERADYYVPTKTLFWSFRIMSGFSFGVMFLFLLSRLILRWIEKQRWLLFLIALCAFVPFVATTAGWLITEFGRYPWTVYGVFTIADSVSPNVSAASLLFTNIVYFMLFTVLAAVLIFLMKLEFKKGPSSYAPVSKPADVDPFEKGDK
ncbi:cytochrome ubiquinol oxidase subunit I [Treponema phagedenis]|uniref:Cytochrome bd ubiquinol oxidase subunit 1 n=1 Tax=Treponema phagedenis TaxID=162 RepID=A0A0B7GTI3_TREPH|nr:cytochrome ubiquinol oxidase subunit I [Treponema phagedenis]QEJ95930.1 cytochrome ubiquinol oxidase subunit I [Treponema phagedenis]QEJ97326.1 cytochrome ubiquinol oxidase subunit I [Treponema phagedenis]QEK00371.1 cytochrome ubiquinol oxidase subunit I [Treponema phagedenis]QEK02480.1 cytochrome ubiquinol oxidase subunit I [Treponema phagedenis]QEK05380.1 cytochrome ubiquinol oxidase subunit I [Treponema phagedenis]